MGWTCDLHRLGGACCGNLRNCPKCYENVKSLPHEGCKKASPE